MNRIEEYGVWRKQGLCKDKPLDTMFPETKQEERDAKNICAQCPVQDVCLETAMQSGEKYGMRGGVYG